MVLQDSRKINEDYEVDCSARMKKKNEGRKGLLKDGAPAAKGLNEE